RRRRWWPNHKFGEPPQILSNRCQRELEPGTARAAQAQSVEPQNALEMCEQHLDLLTIAARLRESCCLCDRTGNIACGLMNAAHDFALRGLGTASVLQPASSAIVHTREVMQHVVVANAASRGQRLACRTDVPILRLIVDEVLARECAVLTR